MDRSHVRGEPFVELVSSRVNPVERQIRVEESFCQYVIGLDDALLVDERDRLLEHPFDLAQVSTRAGTSLR